MNNLTVLSTISFFLGISGYILILLALPKSIRQLSESPKALKVENILLVLIVGMIAFSVGYRLLGLFCMRGIYCFYYNRDIISLCVSIAFFLLGVLLVRLYYSKKLIKKE